MKLFFIYTRCLIAAVLILFNTAALAHSLPNAKLIFDLSPLLHTVIIEYPAEALSIEIGLDKNQNNQLEWLEVKQNQSSIVQQLEQSLTVTAEGQACLLSAINIVNSPASKLSLAPNAATPRIAAKMQIQCTASNITADNLYIGSRFASIDNSIVKMNGQANMAVMKNKLSPSPLSSIVGANAAQSNWKLFIDFIWQGVIHILIGYDHILFLLALLIAGASWSIRKKQLSAKPMLKKNLIIITSFTLAHSITLITSSLQLITAPVHIVEAIIAFSVCLAAILHYFPSLFKYSVAITFAFGLIHGFGFAFVLSDLLGTQSNLTLPLLAFNLGVELGQIVIMLLALPVLLIARRYKHGLSLLHITNAVILVFGVIWLIQRLS